MKKIKEAPANTSAPMQNHYNKNLNLILSKLGTVKKHGKEYIAKCPAHEDKNPSLSVSSGEDGKVLLHCHAGCVVSDILSSIGLETKDLFSDNGQSKSEIIATYDYRDEDGKLLYQTVRFFPKDFKQRRPDGFGGWIWNLKGIDLVLYNLQAVIEAIKANETVYIVEGEKDANNLISLGLTATTSPLGSGKWRDGYSEYLKDASVVLFPDNDESGKEHAQRVANSLKGIAASIKIVNLPGLSEKQDVTDWLKNHSKDDLCISVQSVQPLDAEACTQTTQTSQIKLRPWSDVVLDSVQDREWIVYGMLPQKGLAILGGWAKEGKSTLAIHLCRSVADGLPFLGLETAKMPAVYINYEMPEDYRGELMAAANIPEGAYWLDRPEHVLSIETIEKIIKETKSPHGLLVIDSFRGAFRCVGEKENQAGGAGLICRDLQKVATDTGWLIVLIHHTNRKGSLSGTGDFYAAPDVYMLWKRTHPNEPGELKIEGRMAPIEPMAIRLTLEAAEYIGEAKEVLASEDLKRVVSALSDKPIQANDVADMLKIKPGSVRAYLAKLYQDGKIERSGNGKRGDPYLYYKQVESQQNEQFIAEALVDYVEKEFDAVEIEDDF